MSDRIAAGVEVVLERGLPRQERRFLHFGRRSKDLLHRLHLDARCYEESVPGGRNMRFSSLQVFSAIDWGRIPRTGGTPRPKGKMSGTSR